MTFCRELAGQTGQVVIGLDSDNKIRQDKGPNRPIFEHWERKRNLLNLKIGSDFVVDEVIGFDTNEELYELIKNVSPSVIVKGMDYVDKVVIGSDIAQVIYCPLVDDMSSSKIIERIKGKKIKQI